MIIIKSDKKSFQVYGENFEKIVPYDTKLNRKVFVIENLMAFSHLYVTKGKFTNVEISVRLAFNPINNPLPELLTFQLMLRHMV